MPLEYILHRQVSHVEGVIQLLDGVDIGNRFVLVMERMVPSRDLFHLVVEYGPLSEEMAKCYFRQVTDAVVGCFRAGVFHRDIKVITSKNVTSFPLNFMDLIDLNLI